MVPFLVARTQPGSVSGCLGQVVLSSHLSAAFAGLERLVGAFDKTRVRGRGATEMPYIVPFDLRVLVTASLQGLRIVVVHGS